MRTISLIDVASYLPKKRVSREYFARFSETDELADNVIFKAPPFRHHVAPDETAPDMVEKAAQPLIERHGERAVRDVDVLIAHTFLPDIPFVGAGGEIARRLGANPEWLVDLHNGGCASFVHAMKLARHILGSSDASSALICTTQHFAGQVYAQPEACKHAQAAIPGDGAGVGLLAVSDQSPILDIEAVHFNEYAGEMTADLDGKRKYWEAGAGEFKIGFTETKIANILDRGNRLVPAVTSALCERIGAYTTDIDVFITNQPNRRFLRNWGEAVRPRHYPDTFDECGNLFGAAVPITLDRELRASRVADGSLVVLAGFAHAGDFAGAAAIRWHAV